MIDKDDALPEPYREERGDGMSYIVPGKLPTSCCGCHMFTQEEHDLWCISNHYAGYCKELGKFIDEDTFVNERHPDCTLVEIKTPHGRLIDADKLANETFYGATSAPYITYRKFVNAPTVIEAED